VALATLAAPVAAQLPDDPAVRRALELVRADNEWTLEQQVALCEIPAPPFKEAARGTELVARLRALGYRDATVDSVGNVIAVRKGTGGGRRLVLSAHLDTVFPEGTAVRVTRTGTRLAGPGIGDDCRGLAVLLAVARALEQARVSLAGDLVLVGTVGEEGPGNLRGVRHLFERRPAGPMDAFVSVDGVGFGLTTRSVGSHRYEISFRNAGGHRYGDFVMPNPIHALGRAIAATADLVGPAVPKTTFNVGIVGGGTSVNSIAGSASMQVDLRSESPAALARVDSALRAVVARAARAEEARWSRSGGRDPSKDIAVEWREIGKRPAGTQADTIRLVRHAIAAGTALGLPAPRTQASSTDANVPMSLGIPAETIDGGGRGDGAHSLGEWYEDDQGFLGVQRVLLLVVLELARERRQASGGR
jgi:acetylornithine deacetylase/succinyl-diaminopimelate desuccinylase-like protein